MARVLKVTQKLRLFQIEFPLQSMLILNALDKVATLVYIHSGVVQLVL